MKYKIKELREKRRMSQAELSELSGVNRGTIVRLESDNDVETTVGTLKAIADVLNVTVGYLILP